MIRLAEFADPGVTSVGRDGSVIAPLPHTDDSCRYSLYPGLFR
jgi:hypothetical protein